VKHFLHEGNAYADVLAKLGATSSSDWDLLQVPPLELTMHLLANMGGVMFSRI